MNRKQRRKKSRKPQLSDVRFAAILTLVGTVITAIATIVVALIEHS